MQKWVERLSLLFDFEDKNLFKQRVQLSKFYQKRAEDEIRFQNYAQKIPDEKVSELSEDWKEEIKYKSWIKKKKYRQDELLWAAQLSSKIMKTVEAEYSREMKNCYVLNEMKDKKKLEKFKKLRIAIRKPEKKIPFYGTIDKLKYDKSFKQLSDKLISSHSTREPQLVDALKFFSECNQKHMFKELLVFNLSLNDLPYQLDSFCLMQENNHKKNFTSLGHQWRDFITSEIAEYMRPLKDFNPSTITDKSIYDQPERLPMKRFFKRIDLIFRESVKHLTEYNISCWIKTLRQFVLLTEEELDAQGGEVWKISQKPMIAITIHSKEKDKKDKKDKKRKKKENPGDLIFFKPSEDEVLEKMKRPLMWLINSINQLKNLKPDIVNIAKLESKPAFPVSKELPMFSEALEKVDYLVRKGFEEPNQILEQFQQYCFLLSKSGDDSIKINWGKNRDNRKNVEDLDKQLNRYKTSIKEIQGLCINERNCHFFQIRTEKIKATLIGRAQDRIKEIKKKINEQTVKFVKEIQNKYEDLKKKMTTEPESEEELMDMQKAIENYENTLQDLDKDVDEAEAYMDLLLKYEGVYDRNEIIKFWLLKVMPTEVKTASKEGMSKATKFEKIFSDRLDLEKEEFEQELIRIQNDFLTFSKMDNYTEWKNKEEQNLELNKRIEIALKKRENFNKREGLFGLEETKYEHLTDLKDKNEPYEKMRKISSDYETSKMVWKDGPLMKIKYSTVSSKLESWNKQIDSLKRRFEAKEDAEEAVEICRCIKEDISDFKKRTPLIRELTREAISKNPIYWSKILEDIGAKVKLSRDQTNLQTLLQKTDIMDKFEIVETICVRADKEYSLKVKFNEGVMKTLNDCTLEILDYKTSGTYILGDTGPLQIMFDEQFNTIVMMKQNPHIEPIRHEVESIEKKLIAYQDMFDSWIKCQRGWIYLEPIFSSDEMKKELPREKTFFEEVDKKWREVMDLVKEDAKIFQYPDWDKIAKALEKNNELLDEINKELNKFLEGKRKIFPRFYFLSDEELLEILSKAKDPTLMKKYMNKCFEAIHTVDFNANLEVVNMKSKKGEVINFLKPVVTNEADKRGKVEIWLGDFEEMMKQTLIQKAIDASQDVMTKRTEWVLKWPAQIVLAVNNIRWTSGVEESITVNTLKEYNDKLISERNDIVQLVKGKLTPLERLTLGALIIIDQHAIYVVEDLIKERIASVDEFDWISQLRYYFRTEKRVEKIQTEMITSNLPYQYEYIGNSSRLVITQLTDRCYRTLMGAYETNYGGAPEGPAGTGKTETVKDLAKAIAVPCVVFNCSDQMNYVAMSKFFKGLSQCGAWCCFDEFNRILPEVLSVIAEQVRCIQSAIRSGVSRFIFEGIECRLSKSAFTCITMNPGYAGRAELPDNLKALFRPCAMMVPDYSAIAEIVLYSSGFFDAKNLAKKLVASQILSSEQLSGMKHYDFGMRALKAILVAAGNLKKEMDEADESALCLKALNNVNLPKFTQNDIPLFTSITNDLFRDTLVIKTEYKTLTNKLKETCLKMELESTDIFVNKCKQLYETLLVRHGLMLVGETMSGKSSVINALKDSLTALHGQDDYIKTVTYSINPKAIKGFQLYGKLDPDTKLWTDGVLPQIMRQCEREAEVEERKWIVFDGPVDANWIENMNTVLDDNRILCLTNGQKIRVTEYMNLMFEVENLFYASPATVSRCGMVYLEPSQLGWEPLMKAYINFKMDPVMEEMKKMVWKRMEWFLTPCLVFAQKRCSLPFLIDEMEMTSAVITIFNACVQWVKEREPLAGKEGEGIVNNFCLFSVFWGIGGVFEEKSRKEYHNFIMKMIYYEDVREIYEIVLDKEWEPNRIVCNLGEKVDNLYDLVFDKQSFNWMAWTKTVPRWVPPKDEETTYNKIFVPTSDTIRNQFFIELMLETHCHILLTGPTGTAKTVGAISTINEKYSTNKIGNIMTVFSGQTFENQVQLMIESKMTSRKGKKGHWGPEDTKDRMIIFIDDVNMPQKEKYEAQPPIELLRMWHDYGFWYDLEDRERKYLHHMTFVATMGPPSIGRNMVTRRYLRHFFKLYTESFSNASLETIFSSVLDWYFLNVRGQMESSIRGLQENIVKATIRVYQEVTQNLLPTPSKSHYLYNLRDISRVFQGITKARARSFTGSIDFVKLWAHECIRVFMDRLTNKDDIDLFMESILKIVMKEDLKRTWSDSVKFEPLLWADFIPTIYPNGDKSKRPYTGVYCELVDRPNIQKYSDEYLRNYNEEKPDKLNLVLFSTAIEHLVRIVRIVSCPNGHAFLVGVGGSGKRSLAKLSAFICGFTVFQIELTKKYEYEKDWMDDLIEMFQKCGVQDDKTMFLFSDTQIFKEEVLEDISSILNQGERPNLFPLDKKAEIIEEISENNQDEMKGKTNNQRFEFFIQKCKENIHIALTFSPVGEVFRRRLRTFPSLINCTTIDWFLPWPNTALESVAKHLLKETELETSMVNQIAKLFVGMHSNIIDMSRKYLSEYKKYFYVTPKTYLELIDCFRRSLRNNIDDNKNNIDRYVNGLDKLLAAKEEVEAKKKELEILQPKLKQAYKDTDALIATVKEEQEVADKKKVECEAEEVKCNEQRDKANILKDECQREVDKLEPILMEALKNLEGVKRADIDFIKSTKIPSEALKLLFKALCILYGLKEGKKVKLKKDPNDQFKKIPDYFEAARKYVMNNPNVMLKNLKSYKEEKITDMDPTIIKKWKVMIDTESNFTEAAISRSSGPAGKIYNWILCIIEVFEKLLLIIPKRESRDLAQESLDRAEALLKQTKDNLQAIIDKIASLKQQLKEAQDNKAHLESEVKRCKRQVISAEQLMEGLASEKETWKHRSEELKKLSVTILGDTLLSAGIIAYLGAFPKDYRDTSIEHWKDKIYKCNIQVAMDYSLRKTCCDDLTIGNWVDKFSLPNDQVSIQNAIILHESSRYPLIIDPQVQANRWIKKLYKSQNIKVMKPTDDSGRLTNIIAESIQQGFPVLIENVGETLGSMFESVLEKNIKKEGGLLVMKFLDKFLSYEDTFRFFITTKLTNPHYPPEICAQVTLLNFQVTPEGLEDQLVNKVVVKEHANMANKWQGLIKRYYDLMNKTKETEKLILNLLKDQKGNILDDEKLIETLNKSKNSSKEAELGLNDIETNRKKMKKISENYKECGFRVSNLFFCVTDMASVEPMYQFSLDWFMELFEKAIAADPKVKETRVDDIVRTFTHMLFTRVSRSLFEKDKLLFSFLIYLKVLHCDDQVTQAEIRKLLLVNVVNTKAEKQNPCALWLSEKQWDQICELSTFAGGIFKGVDDSFGGYNKEWRDIYQSIEPQDSKFPGEWEEKLSDVQKLIIMRILRPDKVLPAIQKAISKKLGNSFIDWETFSLDSILQDSTPLTPIIFILSSGSDPLDQIFKLGRKLNQEIRIVSLGQGQDKAANAAIEAAKKKGEWIVLQNCHLAPSYLAIVEKDISNTTQELSPEYRLLLTSIPSKDFPVTILQQGVKVTNEPPRGLRANLMKSYMRMDKTFEEIEKNRHAWKKLVFGLSFFHALILERRKFGALGWNKPYEFSQMDMDISVKQLRIFLEKYDDVPWKALNYMIAEANYGGRVTDPRDRRLIKILLSNFFNDEILEEGYRFSPSGIYYAPEEGDLASYIEYIKTKLPLNDRPEVFGLHDNANITSGINDTNGLLDTILSLQPQSSGEGGESPDEIITKQCEKILSDLPGQFDEEAVARKYPVVYEESMNTVLQQELMRFNILQAKIKETLEQLTKAIAGTVIMNSELEEVYNKLFMYKVPESWHKVSYPSLKPLSSWVDDFKRRIKFFNNWIENDKPSAYWLPGFFSTQSFLTGTLQNYARKVKI